MRTTAHNATTASTSKTGLLALLGSLLHIQGAGAPKISSIFSLKIFGQYLRARNHFGRASNCFRVTLVALVATLGALVFTTAPALAAAPETPEASVEDTTAVVATPSTEAILHGVLDPNIASGTPSEVLDYEFVYRESKTACKGAGEVKTVPQGMSLGMGREEPSQQITGLKPGTEYTVCLLAHNSSNLSEETPSAPVTFTTATPPQAPETSSPAKSITATSAVLEGTLNPSKEAEAGWHFLYSTEPKCAEGASEAPGEEVKKVAAKTKEHVTVAELQPNKKYMFCLVATNSAGEAVQSGNEVTFKTEPAPPVVEGESTSGVTLNAAGLEATVNPNNEETGYKFDYSTKEFGGVLQAPITTVAGAPPAALLPAVFGGQGTGAVTTGAVLVPDTTYYFRALAENEQSKKEGKPVTGTVAHFLTAPEAPEKLGAESIAGTTAKLRGVLNPNNAGEPVTYEFLYRQSESECQYVLTPEEEQRLNEVIQTSPSVGQKKAAEAELNKDREMVAENKATSAKAGAGAKDEEAFVEATGLSPGSKYTFCLRVHNATGEATGPPETFETDVLGEAFATSVTANEALLTAEIGPAGAVASYHAEYGTNSVAESSTPEAHTLASGTPVSVQQTLSGLKAATTYHYRFVANNGHGPVVGEEHSFTTTAGAEPPQNCTNEHLRAEQPYGLTLPDCRAYEMVSPPNTNGNDATEAGAASSARASAPEKEGEPEKQEPAITYPAKGSFGDPTGALVENQYVSRRTPTGWSTQATTPLSSTPVEETREGNETSYPTAYFTPELTAGLALTSARLNGAPPLQANNIAVYVANFATELYEYVGETSLYGNEPPWGASRGLERVVLSNPENGALLEWVNGTDVPVSISNGGQEMEASAGSSRNGVSETEKDAWHATSADGSRVYFTSPKELGQDGQLYVRVNIGEGPDETFGAKGECLEPTKECTIEVSASQREPEDPSGSQPARYWGASADGSKVFFTSSAELTQNAYTGSAGSAPNLYEYDLETGELTDLTVPTAAERAEDPNGAAVQGVVQISEDGAYVYFVADGALAPGAMPQTCTGSGTGEGCNLYVSHEGGEPVFVATLVGKDKTDWLNRGIEDAGPEINTAVVTPDGSRLAFISEASLTGYDNEQAQQGECKAELGGGAGEEGACREVFVYQAPANLATEPGTLACASCNPTGARPVGPASIPGVQAASSEFGSYRPRDLLADGALFFDSKDALVPHASDGRENVYEYEGGAVHAISNVAGGDESFFLDAGPSGENVFFVSADKLLPEDPGGNAAVWDAREDGGFPVVSLPASCDNADSCKAPESPQPGVFAPPASSTFSGPGNTTPPAPAVAKKVTKKIVTCKKGVRHECKKKAKSKHKSARKAARQKSRRS